MVITINNVGPLASYHFDLRKDFHLVIGDNSTGKSYAVTIVYLILKTILKTFVTNYNSFYRDYDPSDDEGGVSDSSDETKRKVSERLNKSFGSLKAILEKSFLATFESILGMRNGFSGGEATISIETDCFDLTLLISDKVASSVLLKKDIVIRDVRRKRKPKEENDGIVFYRPDGKGVSYYEINNFLLGRFSSEILEQIRYVYFLPASRSGLYQALSAFGQIIVELSKNRSLLRSPITLPGIPEPLSDYFMDFLMAANSKLSVERDAGIVDELLYKVARRIEDDILRGKVEYDRSTKKIFFVPDNTTIRLDLSQTSSMVSEVSPIMIFVYFILSQKRKKRNLPDDSGDMFDSVLFIEEPEAHLHPEVQVRLTEMFAELVRAGVKIVMTSHSNYIFNKTNNLILAKQLDSTKVQVTVVKMEKVGSVGHNLPVDQMGVDDENFVDVAERIYKEKMDLFARIVK